jgi:glutamate-1-semialdehyde 2,1-aminomutase
LPGLKPAGVPRGLKGTAYPFNYNCINELEEIIEKNDIGVIVMEPIRNHEPENDFLGRVRRIADEIGAVFIFDEITSGWRLNVGGVHLLYNVQPDIAVYGKAMSNGFPMAAVVGKRDVMNAAQDTFISSTYWTDRIGPTASLVTIHKMQDNNVPAHLSRIGNLINKGWDKLAKEQNLKINIEGILPLTHFGFDYEDSLALHTLFTQEMLIRGYLASKAVYVSYCHSEECVERYLESVNEVFGIVKKAVDQNNAHDLLRGPIANTGFKRLN